MDFLLILLTVLGIILLIVLIILCVRLNFTLTRLDIVLEDFKKKLDTVTHAFELTAKVSNSISLVSDRVIEGLSTFITNLFLKKDKKNIEEEEF